MPFCQALAYIYPRELCQSRHWSDDRTRRPASLPAAFARAGRRVLAGAALLLAASPALRAQQPVAREYQVKAVFLFNFPHFVDWPPSAFASAQAPFVIGVLGADPFGTFLDQLVRGETVNERAFVVRHFRRIEDVDVCHVLFIAEPEAARLKDILQRLRGRTILTVGDGPSFLLCGGMIRFETENNRIRLRIDAEVARQADLTLSSKLLRRAELVSPGED